MNTKNNKPSDKEKQPVQGSVSLKESGGRLLIQGLTEAWKKTHPFGWDCFQYWLKNDPHYVRMLREGVRKYLTATGLKTSYTIVGGIYYRLTAEISGEDDDLPEDVFMQKLIEATHHKPGSIYNQKPHAEIIQNFSKLSGEVRNAIRKELREINKQVSLGVKETEYSVDSFRIVEDAILLSKLKELLPSLLEKLSPQQKRAVTLKYLDGSERSNKEVAAIMGITPERVRQLVETGSRKIKPSLEEYEFNPES